jgi:hypothetical protein
MLILAVSRLTYDRNNGIVKTYKVKTGYSSLRVHLEKVHKEEYLRLCKEKGWKNQLPTEVKARKAACLAASQSLGQGVHPRQPYSQEALLKHLINFIVADDQVRALHGVFLHLLISSQSINVIECPEFRGLLLLLRPDLEERDIPHRTRLRQSIIEAWNVWFRTLQRDLSVCFVIITRKYHL